MSSTESDANMVTRTKNKSAAKNVRKRKSALAKILLTLIALSTVAAYFLTVPMLNRWLHLPAAILDERSFRIESDSGFPVTRHVVPLQQVSPYVTKAILAAEDRHFYMHHGIDGFGVLRATLVNMKAGKLREGGSTISQQLAKVRFLDYKDRTPERKLSQMVLAWELESRYSKRQILESYLNTVYFGNGAYGIESAAQRYFGCHAAKLNLPQAAFLCGLVQAPSDLGAKAGLTRAVERQQEILDKLVEYDMLDVHEVKQAKAFRLNFQSGLY